MGLVGSNPTPGAFSSTPCVETRHIQPIEPTALSQIISFGLWMRKQGYRRSTVRYCIQALKSIARHANLLQPESAKAYLACAEMSESRKAKLTEASTAVLRPEAFQEEDQKTSALSAHRVHSVISLRELRRVPSTRSVSLRPRASMQVPHTPTLQPPCPRAFSMVSML